MARLRWNACRSPQVPEAAARCVFETVAGEISFSERRRIEPRLRAIYAQREIFAGSLLLGHSRDGARMLWYTQRSGRSRLYACFVMRGEPSVVARRSYVVDAFIENPSGDYVHDFAFEESVYVDEADLGFESDVAFVRALWFGPRRDY